MENQKKKIHVVAALIRNGNKVFATQRGYGKYKDWWEFPGGKIEPGETPEQALHRELIEEMDFDVEVCEHLATVTHDYPDFTITLAAYRCKASTTAFTMREHAASRWLPWNELSTLPWCAADERLIAQFTQTE